MKTKRSYIASALLSILLCAVMLCGAILPMSAESREIPSLDYSNPAMESAVTLSAGDLYQILLGRTPTEGELLYWNANELALSYSDFIPSSSVDTQYDGDKGTLAVTVTAHTYTAVNGLLVKWIPEFFMLEGVRYDLLEENGVYIAQVENCYHSGDFTMQVEYGCEIEISQSIIQALASEAYEVGHLAVEEMSNYRAAVEEYTALVAAHKAYNDYKQWEADFANYLAQKAIYDGLVSAYNTYLNDLDAYQVELDAYNQWQEYFVKEQAYKDNEKPYAEYVEYYKVYSAAVAKLSMFETVFKKDSNGWCMYNDIKGSTVTQVLDKQDLLIKAGGNKADILLAGEATQNLRVLLKEYNTLRTKKWSSEYQKNKALYEYYIANYDALEKNFCDLYKTLKGLYDNTLVSTYIKSQGKAAHYRQLVAHLFVVSTAFDQDGYRNESTWRMDKKTLREVLEDIHYSPDGDWDPNNTPYPAKEVAPVERLEKPVRPTVAQPTVEPEAPTPVAKPGNAPTVVEDPSGTPCPPKPEKELGDKPEAPVFDAIKEALYQEVLKGTLKAPATVTSSKVIKRTASLERKISIENLKTVTFYNSDGSIYKQEEVHYGGRVKGDALHREPTAEYVYEFLGWNYADGTVAPEWITVTENISLYPRYRLTKQMYTITWVLDGQSYTQDLYYGVMPVPEYVVDISSRENQYYYYEFSGWDHKVVPVTGNATYTGSMIRTPKKFNVTWVIQNGAQSVTQEWAYDQVPVFEGDLSISSSTHLYEFLGWDKTVAPVSRDVTYTAQYRATPLATSGSVAMETVHTETEIQVLATKSSISAGTAARLAAEQGKTLTIVWQDALSVSLVGEALQAYLNCGAPTVIMQTTEEGNIATYEFKYFNVGANASMLPELTVTFAYSKVSGKETVFDLQTENGWERQESTQITAKGDFKARRLYSYSIVPVANEYCNVTQIVTKATEGEWVSIALECVYGYKVTGATIVTADGKTIVVEGTSFQMPASPATVSLEVKQIVYTVTFLVDGQVWDSAQYYSGEEIVLPQDPTKAEANGFVYTFIGWGNVPPLATGEEENLVFEAVFTQSQTVNDYETGNDNNTLVTVILPCVGAVVVLVVAFLIVNRIVRKRGGWRVATTKFAARMRAVFAKVANLFKKKK